MDKSNLGDRISFLINKKGISLSQLARAADVKPSSVAAWADGKTANLRSNVALNLAKALNLNLSWLVEGKGQPFVDDAAIITNNEDQFYCVRFLDEKKSICNGEFQAVTFDEGIMLKSEFFEKNNLSSTALLAIEASNNDLDPLIARGDIVIIDSSTVDLKNRGVYLFFNGSSLYLRRVAPLLKGGAFLSTLAPLREEELLESELKSLKIVGRVAFVHKEFPM